MVKAKTETVGRDRIVYNCQTCGWNRTASVTPEWLARIILHPIYGKITQRRMVTLDIGAHECKTTIAVIGKLQRADKKRSENEAA